MVSHRCLQPESDMCRNTQGISECEEWSYEELDFEILGAEKGHELR